MSNNGSGFRPQNGQPSAHGQFQNGNIQNGNIRNTPPSIGTAPFFPPPNRPTTGFDGRPAQSISGLKQKTVITGPSQIMPSSPIPPNTPQEQKKVAPRNHWLGIASMGVSGIVILAILAVLAVRGLSGGQTDVTLYKAGTGTVKQDVGGGGVVFPLQQINISYPITERVVKIPIKAGDPIKVGDTLLQLDPTQINIQVRQASDQKAAALAFLNTVSVTGTATAIADAQKQYDVAQSQYNALVAQSSSILVHNGNIISPMAGVVTVVNINPGEVFAADTPLLTIMDESAAIVHVKIPLTDIQQVHLGQSAVITPAALPNLNLTGTVTSIIPVADAQTDTFEVWVKVQNTTQALLPGMSAFVRIQSAPARAVVIPRMAVMNPPHDATVFLVRNQHAYLAHVHVSGRSVDNVYVDSGLSQGDTVALTGVYQLKDGQAVHVIKTEGA